MKTITPDLPSGHAVPDLEAAYMTLRPAMYRALGRLARQGFIISPTDLQDMIHDFFVEAWPGLALRYNPALSSFEAYAYGAFVQFVRPKVIRLHRLQHDLTEPALLQSIPGGDTPEAELSHDRDLLLRAIKGLPDLLGQVLTSYCYAGESERALARKMQLSRYKLRELLIDALGRVVVALDRPEAIPESDWTVAKAVWLDQRSVWEEIGRAHV